MSASRSKYLNIYSTTYLNFHQQRMALKVSMTSGNCGQSVFRGQSASDDSYQPGNCDQSVFRGQSASDAFTREILKTGDLTVNSRS